MLIEVCIHIYEKFREGAVPELQNPIQPSHTEEEIPKESLSRPQKTMQPT